MGSSVDTIAALATPPGRGGIGVIRISGPLARDLAIRVLGHCPEPRHAEYLPFQAPDGELLDEGIALFFQAPHSFTGEDVLELQGHGGPIVLDRLLELSYQLGARPARPGEFSERAFLNGKMDLAQAEAVADFIDSASLQAAQSALRSMRGEFSERVTSLVDGLTELRMYVESAIDFTDEDIDFLADGQIEQRLRKLADRLDGVRAAARQGSLLREGMTVVIAGRPNAGKSSLLNQLAGRATAIVTEIPGTTRDILREEISIDGMPLHIIDTAGLREAADIVEQEGIRRAWSEIEQADRLLLVVDDTVGITSEEESLLGRLPPTTPVTVIRNKVDLSARPMGIIDGADRVEIALSAKSGQGIDFLRDHLKKSMGYQAAGEGIFMARRRHLDALETAAAHLQTAASQLRDFHAGELVAEELRLTQQALGQITGEFTADDLLGKIFASFCIGK